MKMLIAFIIGLIAAPIIFALVGIAGWLPSDAASNPPGWESSIGMRALDASLEKRSGGLTNPVQPNDAAASAAGKKLYADNCAGCHGDAKGPSDWGAKGLYPRAPQFFQEGSDVSPREAFAAIHGGVRYSGMGAWKDQLNDQQIWQVANFVAHIQAPGGKKMDMDRD
ncbi:MAG TPA: cytochrome c [Sphingomicrobium sp.]|nr:cytochrome c [Sphingomicrobium sp.]